MSETGEKVWMYRALSQAVMLHMCDRVAQSQAGVFKW